MASHYARIGSAIADGRPWNYFPESLRSDVARTIDGLVGVRAAVGFDKLPCNVVIEDGDNVGEKPRPKRRRDSECPACWKLQMPVSYEADGLVAFRFQSKFDAGPLGTIIVRADIGLGEVGVLKIGTQSFETPHVGTCPESCSDEWIGGELACELQGSISITATYFDVWNTMALGSYISGLASAFGFLGAGSTASINDYLTDRPTEDMFTVGLRGGGPNNGIVYPLGAFELRPP